MAFDYLAGTAANLVTGATITASSEDTNYDADNVGVGWPAKPFRFNAAAADDTLDFDFASAKQPTLVSLHGHNIDSGITSVTVLSDDNSSFTSPVTEDTIAFADISSPTVYTTIAAPTSHRYWRFKFNGTNGAAIEIGEAVMGVKSSLTRAQLIDWKIGIKRPQSRQTGAGVPQVFASNLSDFHQRTLSLSFVATDYDERDEIDALFTATAFGEQPFICVPDSGDSIVIHGRLPSEYEWERIPGPSGGYHRTSFTVEEDPFTVGLT